MLKAEELTLLSPFWKVSAKASHWKFLRAVSPIKKKLPKFFTFMMRASLFSVPQPHLDKLN